MRPTWIVAALLAAGSLSAATALRAEDTPPAGKAPPPAVKKDEPKKDETVLRIERAKLLVKELEDAVTRAKAAQPLDAQLLQKLFEALDEARALARPAKPEELTADEKKAVLDEAKKAAPGAEPAPRDPMNDWQARQLQKAFEGVELTKDEETKARQLIGDWFKEAMSSMGDSKRTSDLKRSRDEELEKAVGKKKAQKIINNLNAMGPGRR